VKTLKGPKGRRGWRGGQGRRIHTRDEERPRGGALSRRLLLTEGSDSAQTSREPGFEMAKLGPLFGQRRNAGHSRGGWKWLG